jgi:5-methylcytosine-specific restriction protein A
MQALDEAINASLKAKTFKIITKKKKTKKEIKAKKDIVRDATSSRYKLRQKIFEKFGGVCAYCNKELSFETFTIDHILPKSRGGTNEFSNLTVACKKCNQEKADKIL